jgi:thiol:disulfide interchange protein DsbD
LQSYFQNPWAIGAFSALLVVLALSLFGFYEMQMPHFIQSHLHRRTHHLKGGSFLGVFVLGMISALIIGTCVSPVLISALGAAIASKDPILGGAIMFSLAHGQGVILIALGIGAGFLLPKVGKWMERVKHLFGVLLIAVAIYLLGYLPEVPVLFLWSALFIISAVYLGAVQSLPQNASGWRYLWKGMGLFLLIWGVMALVGGFAGNRDIFSPLPLAAVSSKLLSSSGVAPPSQQAHLFERVSTVRELENRLVAAKAARKPVILDYYADWCTDCLRMEKATFADPGVRAELRSRFVLLQADVTDPNDPEGKAIKRRFGVYGPPAMLFFTPDGAERRDMRTYGFRNVDEFLALLRKI